MDLFQTGLFLNLENLTGLFLNLENLCMGLNDVAVHAQTVPPLYLLILLPLYNIGTI